MIFEKKNIFSEFYHQFKKFILEGVKNVYLKKKVLVTILLYGVFVFFRVFKKKAHTKSILKTLFFTYFFLVLSEKKLFSWPGRQRGISIKNSHNLTMSRKWNRRYIFPEEWSKNNNRFFRSAMEGLWNVFLMVLVKTQKKTQKWKKKGLRLNPGN